MNAHCAPPLPVDTSRTAETVAAELYDEPRELEPFEAEFIKGVRRIGMICAETIGIAARATGADSTVTLAVRMTATARRNEQFAALLAKYDDAREQMVDA